MVPGAGSADGAVFHSLCDRQRRRVLGLLRGREEPVWLDTLATFLAAEESETVPGEVTSAQARRFRADLVHDHLPRLESAGLVRWNRDDGSVRATDHPALSDPCLDRVLDEPCGDWDPILETLDDDRRRRVLAVLRDHGGVMDRRELAMEVVTRECEIDQDGQARRGRDARHGENEDPGSARQSGSERPVTRRNEAVLSLHHVHLPKLERADLVAYDGADGTVSYQGDTTLADELLDVGDDESRSQSSV